MSEKSRARAAISPANIKDSIIFGKSMLQGALSGFPDVNLLDNDYLNTILMSMTRPPSQVDALCLCTAVRLLIGVHAAINGSITEILTRTPV